MSDDVMAFDSEGKRIWRHEIGEPVLCMVKADLNGDGREEIVIGTEDGHVIALNQNGEPIANWATTGAVNKLVVLDSEHVAASAIGGKVTIISMK